MRSYLITAAILVWMLPGTSPLAQEPEQPSEVPSDSTGGGDFWKSTLPQDVQGVLGKEVRSGSGENIGRIVDVLVDKGRQVRAAVIDFGGFLGVGSRKVVVDWAALRFAPASQQDPITLDLTRDQVNAAPEYKPGQPVVVLGSKGLTAVPGM
jgi:hypothetical protein